MLKNLCIVVFALLFLTISSHAQVPGPSKSFPPPPGTLPRLMLECDLNPGVGNACAAWLWDGRRYNATWENGFSGQMTVENAGPALVILRADVTGPTAGLAGKYIGKWDGHQVSDAAFSWTWKDKSVTQTWAARAESAPVTCERPFYLKNWYPSPVTAIVFAATPNAGGQLPGNPVTTVDFRSPSNDTIRLDRPAFMTENNHYCLDIFKSGFGSRTTAAIYADGAAFGDRKQLAAIEAERSNQERQYLHAMTRLCEMGRQGLDYDHILAAFDAEHHADDAAVHYLHLDFRFHPRNPRDTSRWIQGKLKIMAQRRDALRDPVRDEHGNLYINDAEPNPACSLP